MVNGQSGKLCQEGAMFHAVWASKSKDDIAMILCQLMEENFVKDPPLE